ncbi:MAG TPA: DUF748 domain-containing protein [Nevskiaceae bacterium]|nr:DUF748 domain-containing protein [Nevskiaceae bacterium]
MGSTTTMHAGARHRQHLRRGQKLFLAFLILVLALVALRAYLPELVRDQINARIDRMGDYHGHVADVDIHLWRGAYSLNKLVIQKATGKVPVPLLDAPRVDLAISWKEIFHGGIVGRVEFDRAQLNFVDGGSQSSSQAGGGVNWRRELEAILPVKLNEVRVVDSTVFFRNFISNPPVDLRATKVNGVVKNLTNVRDRDGKRVADLELNALILDDAPMETKATFDPFTDFTDFTFDLRVTHIDVTKLNPLFQAYAKLDAASGSGDLVVQMQAKDSQLTGYAKPILQDVKIASWKQDVEEQHDNPLRVAWEATAGFVKNLFKNQPENQLATKVEFNGTLKNPKTSTLDTLINLLHNAFVQAYAPQFDEARKTKPER